MIHCLSVYPNEAGDSCEETVAEVWAGTADDRDIEQGKQIVRACNSHDDLLEACKAVVRRINENCEPVLYDLPQLQAAIAKATSI